MGRKLSNLIALAAAGLSVVLLAAPVAAQTAPVKGKPRDAILVTGSSTVFPFTSAVAQHFAAAGHPPPVINSVGTVHGFNRFCQGASLQHPDIQNASRAMNGNEFSLCNRNGVHEIMQIPIGHDGIVVAYRKDGPSLALTRAQLWRAVAKEVPQGGRFVANPAATWRDIDATLPDWPIKVLGPPRTSGTRDSFVDLVMVAGCQGFPEVRAIADVQRRRAVCTSVREDGRWEDAGEDDEAIVRKLAQAPVGMLGVFGYSFLAGHPELLRPATIDGVAPDADDIRSGRYPVARPLFLYVKRRNLDLVPGLPDFLAAYVSEAAMGPQGYLPRKGLIALDDAQRARVREAVRNQAVMLGRPGS